ncbi:proprotein convertase subtilisin/kexin type 5-like isoform X2 [Pectinophora gossypiella]|uniref:proprotein convertase subtilisin/kexin type 5-like isoform X2 n=1 Tax=Pectinophora gossypiella TaxID=13191 RepID=UPI00214EBDBA|nr:proprotein convertase subtilisin/kexin type 5-like isoform X2 [Pectinophora gossypiella]
MKCFVLVVLCLAYAYGGAIRCPPGTEDISCTAEQEVTTESPTETEALYRRVCKEATGPIVEKCRRYFCTEAGVVAFRTIPNCEPNMTEVRQNCTPGSHFTQDCNMCICLENQLGLCTVKNCGRATIPKKSELVSGKECAAGSSWKSRCNDCGCTPDGYAFCTEKACLDQQEDTVMRCAPDTMWNNECNTCWCTTDGRAMCTRMGCASDQQPEGATGTKALTDVATKSSKNITQKVVCVANRMFIKDCNTCWCNEDGTSFICTRKVCVPELPEEGTEEEISEDLRVIKKECRPDEVFELDCNMCRCNPDGKSFSCTRRACVDRVDEDLKNVTLIRKARGVTQEAPKACQPGQEFRMDCNKCLCDNEGQDFSCTRIDCNAQNGNGGSRSKRETSEQVTTECAPGSVFDMDCNVCRCTTDGHHAMCTTKRCAVPNTQDNDVNSPLSESDPNFRCNPGEQFKRGCNDCSCSADGKSVFCTVRFCDQDITPPPSL